MKVPGLTWTGSLYTLETDTEDGSIRREIRTLLHQKPKLSSRRVLESLNRRNSDVLRVLNQMLTEGELLDLNNDPQRRAFVNADEGARFPETDVSA